MTEHKEVSIMKKLSIVVLLLLIALLSSCQYHEDIILPDELLIEGNPKTSPTGTYVLEYKKLDTTEWESATFEIYTNDDLHQLVYQSDFELYLRFTHFIVWDENTDRVWVYYGDTGIYFTEQIDGVWTRYFGFDKYWLKDIDYEGGITDSNMVEYPEEVTIPAVLIELRPSLAE